MKRILWIGLAAVAAIAGCVPSIHGIATEESIVWDEVLIGRWGDSEKADDPNAEIWQFEKGDKEGIDYTLTHSADGKVGQFKAVLVQVGDMLFLDLFPCENEALENTSDLYKMHLVGMHTFIIIDELGNELKMRMMNADKVEKLLNENPAAVKHEIRGNRDLVILTASPEELQGFLLQYADQIFDDKDGDAMVKLSAGEGK